VDEGESLAPQTRDLRLREHTATEKSMFGGPEVSYHQTYSGRDWLSILRTPYPTQNVERKHRTDSQITTKARKRKMNQGLMKIGVWNVRGLYGKEKLLQEELKK